MTVKILTVVFSLGKGGTERTAQNFACGYSKINCDSRVLCTRIDGPRRQYLLDQRIPVYNLENKADCQEICNWCPDVVHIHSHGITTTEFYIFQALCREAKFVETNVFSRPSPWAKHLLISYQLSQWCDWLFSSRSNHQYRSAILPNAVDTDSFCRSSSDRRSKFRSRYGLLDSDLVIGRVGQGYEGKWSPVLIDVFEEIRKKTANLKLLIVNPPPLILKRALGSRYCRDIVHIDVLHGDMDLADCFSSIDVFVLIASQGESFGMVSCESLLCETPVVALATPWADNSQGEVVGNRIGGFVATTKHELTPLIEKLLFDQKNRVRMGRAGRERTIQLFNAETLARRSLALISNTEYHQSTNVRRPIEIFDECIGSVNIVSRFLLQSGRCFRLLEVTLGYSSLVEFLLVRISPKVSRGFRNCYLTIASVFRGKC